MSWWRWYYVFLLISHLYACLYIFSTRSLSERVLYILRLYSGLSTQSATRSLSGLGRDVIRPCYDIKCTHVLVHILHERRQFYCFFVEYFLYFRFRKILERDFAREKAYNVYSVAVLQKLDGSLQIALIFVEASRFWSVNQPALQAQDKLPPACWTVYILLDVIKELHKAHLACHESGIIVECRPVQEGMLAVPCLPKCL